jgi:hypothetical protein
LWRKPQGDAVAVTAVLWPVLSVKCWTPPKAEPSACFDAIVGNRLGSPIRRNSLRTISPAAPPKAGEHSLGGHGMTIGAGVLVETWARAQCLNGSLAFFDRVRL